MPQENNKKDMITRLGGIARAVEQASKKELVALSRIEKRLIQQSPTVADHQTQAMGDALSNPSVIQRFEVEQSAPEAPVFDFDSPAPVVTVEAPKPSVVVVERESVHQDKSSPKSRKKDKPQAFKERSTPAAQVSAKSTVTEKSTETSELTKESVSLAETQLKVAQTFQAEQEKSVELLEGLYKDSKGRLRNESGAFASRKQKELYEQQKAEEQEKERKNGGVLSALAGVIQKGVSGVAEQVDAVDTLGASVGNTQWAVAKEVKGLSDSALGYLEEYNLTTKEGRAEVAANAKEKVRNTTSKVKGFGSGLFKFMKSPRQFIKSVRAGTVQESGKAQVANPIDTVNQSNEKPPASNAFQAVLDKKLSILRGDGLKAAKSQPEKTTSIDTVNLANGREPVETAQAPVNVSAPEVSQAVSVDKVEPKPATVAMDAPTNEPVNVPPAPAEKAKAKKAPQNAFQAVFDKKLSILRGEGFKSSQKESKTAQQSIKQTVAPSKAEPQAASVAPVASEPTPSQVIKSAVKPSPSKPKVSEPVPNAFRSIFDTKLSILRGEKLKSTTTSSKESSSIDTVNQSKENQKESLQESVQREALETQTAVFETGQDNIVDKLDDVERAIKGIDTGGGMGMMDALDSLRNRRRGRRGGKAGGKGRFRAATADRDYRDIKAKSREPKGRFRQAFDTVDSKGRSFFPRAQSASKGGGMLSKLIGGGEGVVGGMGKLFKPLAALIGIGAIGTALASDDKKGASEEAGGLAGGLGGAVAGGAAGAAIGSIVPIVGTAIGGLLGSILGGIGGDWLGRSAGGGLFDWFSSDKADEPKAVAPSTPGSVVSVAETNYASSSIVGTPPSHRKRRGSVVADSATPVGEAMSSEVFEGKFSSVGEQFKAQEEKKDDRPLHATVNLPPAFFKAVDKMAANGSISNSTQNTNVSNRVRGGNQVHSETRSTSTQIPTELDANLRREALDIR
ncbi:hypothetical protein NTE19_003366 [Vibrio fluvialis]|nr:hypothetical protein [Vibrio fluvialis]